MNRSHCCGAPVTTATGGYACSACGQYWLLADMAIKGPVKFAGPQFFPDPLPAMSRLLESKDLSDETRRLIELAIEAQQTGKMPDISTLTNP